MSSPAPNPNNKTRRVLKWIGATLVAILVGVMGTILADPIKETVPGAVGEWLRRGSSQDEEKSPPTPTESDHSKSNSDESVADPQPSTPSPDDGTEPVREPVEPAPPTREPPPPPTLTGFLVSISEPRNVVYGEKDGPNRFKRDEQHGKVVVSYTWEAIMSNRTVNENLDCAIHAEVSGPQWVVAMETDECTFRDEGSISFSDDNVQEYSEPGIYTVTVTDQITGVTGTAKFTVV